MEEHTIFPREEKTEILFQKILADPWACEKLQETFYNYWMNICTKERYFKGFFVELVN